MNRTVTWPPPFGPGLYLHVPFCRARCTYCDFYRTTDLRLRAEWLDRIGREIGFGAADPAFAGKSFQTVYFGGGTPSLLLGREIARILDALRGLFRLDPGAEITIEANPESVDEARAASWLEAGVNRLSLGIQSFHDDELRLLGRLHNAAEAVRAYGDARRAGFQNIGLDLIYALPGSTVRRWHESLSRALALQPDHLSAYCLTLEGDVPLERAWRKGEVCLPPDDGARAQYDLLTSLAAEAGLGAYEISNFARPGRECRHNENYWIRGDYLGFGPSAHSHGGGRRWWNPSSLEAWGTAIDEGRSPAGGEEVVDAGSAAAEWIFLGLRRAEGIPWETLAGSCPEKGPPLRESAEALVRAGMLEWAPGGVGVIPWLRLTPAARFVSNAVFRELMEALE